MMIQARKIVIMVFSLLSFLMIGLLEHRDGDDPILRIRTLERDSTSLYYNGRITASFEELEIARENDMVIIESHTSIDSGDTVVVTFHYDKHGNPVDDDLPFYEFEGDRIKAIHEDTGYGVMVYNLVSRNDEMAELEMHIQDEKGARVEYAGRVRLSMNAGNLDEVIFFDEKGSIRRARRFDGYDEAPNVYRDLFWIIDDYCFKNRQLGLGFTELPLALFMENNPGARYVGGVVSGDSDSLSWSTDELFEYRYDGQGRVLEQKIKLIWNEESPDLDCLTRSFTYGE